jgi:hypothetical protein
VDACDIITRVRLVSKTRLKKLCGGPCFVCVESELFQKNEKNLTVADLRFTSRSKKSTRWLSACRVRKQRVPRIFVTTLQKKRHVTHNTQNKLQRANSVF